MLSALSFLLRPSESRCVLIKHIWRFFEATTGFSGHCSRCRDNLPTQQGYDWLLINSMSVETCLRLNSYRSINKHLPDYYSTYKQTCLSFWPLESLFSRSVTINSPVWIWYYSKSPERSRWNYQLTFYGVPSRTSARNVVADLLIWCSLAHTVMNILLQFPMRIDSSKKKS